MVNIIKEAEKKEQPYWINYIKGRIRNNKNFLGFISGATGTGKSWSGISICLMADPTFTPKRIVLSIRNLMKLINSGKVKSGNAILFDEAGIDIGSRSWQSVTNKLVNYLLQTFRHKRFILIFTSPYMDFLDAQTRKMFHAEFTTQKIDYVNRKVKLKPHILQYNARSKKFYYKYLRILTKNRGIAPIKSWSVLAPPKWLIEEYEKIKTEFTAKLNKDIERQLDEIELKKGEDRRKPLTTKQEDCLRLMARYDDIDKVAKQLGLTPRTTYFHISQAKKKGYKIEDFSEKGGQKG